MIDLTLAQFAALFGEHFTFQCRRHLDVGAWATYLVMARSDTHARIIAYLSVGLDKIKLGSIGKVVIDTFKDRTELEKKLTQRIEDALAQAQSEIPGPPRRGSTPARTGSKDPAKRRAKVG